MTEESLRAGRKIMQKANAIRVLIKKAEDQVKKWNAFESFHRENLHENQATAAKKNIYTSIERLEKRRKQFADLKFPESNMPEPKKQKEPCAGCSTNCYNWQIGDCRTD